ncbi:uncharacterized protein [Spinacia oleracea]|uniref:Uncharacterized protein isoform X2 n=1 Tax=Spinacia oleracea TaxID=3562 RepID=A0A9R0IZ65_SPIOL|nr:uncharacterized protein LOC110797489 isoform X2 [Spinacia oleracea]
MDNRKGNNKVDELRTEIGSYLNPMDVDVEEDIGFTVRTSRQNDNEPSERIRPSNRLTGNDSGRKRSVDNELPETGRIGSSSSLTGDDPKRQKSNNASISNVNPHWPPGFRFQSQPRPGSASEPAVEPSQGLGYQQLTSRSLRPTMNHITNQGFCSFQPVSRTNSSTSEPAFKPSQELEYEVLAPVRAPDPRSMRPIINPSQVTGSQRVSNISNTGSSTSLIHSDNAEGPSDMELS